MKGEFWISQTITACNMPNLKQLIHGFHSVPPKNPEFFVVNDLHLQIPKKYIQNCGWPKENTPTSNLKNCFFFRATFVEEPLGVASDAMHLRYQLPDSERQASQGLASALAVGFKSWLGNLGFFGRFLVGFWREIRKFLRKVVFFFNQTGINLGNGEGKSPKVWAGKSLERTSCEW